MKYVVAAVLLASSFACARATVSGLESDEDASDASASAGDPDAGGGPRDDAAMPLPDAGGIEPAVSPVINEFVADHLGTDASEFVEIAGDPGVDHSAWSVLVVEGDGAGKGAVDVELKLGTMSASGFYATPMLNNVIENGTVTLLLVRGYDPGGAAVVDLDTDNDGSIDAEPWQELADAVGITNGEAGDATYAGAAVLSPSFDGGTLQVGGASRIPDGQDANVAADWKRNDFDGSGLACCTAATPSPGEARNTPGAANAMQP
jgi:hypothetical protein